MGVSDEMLDQIFDFMIRDFSSYATELMMKPSNTDDQREYAKALLKSPVPNEERFNKIWDEVYSLKDAYKMKDQE
jgi:acyl-CoA dehydrogenase